MEHSEDNGSDILTPLPIIVPIVILEPDDSEPEPMLTMDQLVELGGRRIEVQFM